MIILSRLKSSGFYHFWGFRKNNHTYTIRHCFHQFKLASHLLPSPQLLCKQIPVYSFSQHSSLRDSKEHSQQSAASSPSSDQEQISINNDTFLEKQSHEVSPMKESLKDAFDQSEQLTFHVSSDTLLAHDYTNSATHLKFSSSDDSENTSTSQLQGFRRSADGLEINSTSELQLKNNPLALRVLTTGIIDLKDSRITVNTLDSTDSLMMGGAQGLHQISLGIVDVLPENSILLEDIDVNNIPEDKNIIIDKTQKTLLAIGRKIVSKRRQSSSNSEDIYATSSQSELETRAQSSSSSSTTNPYSLSVDRKVFEELSLDEFKDKYLWSFEKDFVTFDFGMLFRALLSTLPLVILSILFFDTLLELYRCKRNVHLMEEQLLNPFIDVRRSRQHDLLLNDQRFDRNFIFPKHIQSRK